MPRFVVLLRGVNVSASTRIAMSAFRDLLGEAGFEDVRTHLQSGNALVTGAGKPEAVARTVNAAVADRLGMEIDVVVRTAAELRRAIDRDPLGSVATDGAKHFITFLSAPHDTAEVQRMAESVAGTRDEVRANEREIYLWCPDGIRNSPLAKAATGKRDGSVATVRNWNTVTRLVAMLDEEA